MALHGLQLRAIPLEIPGGANIIVGQSHFIKTVEDLYEALTTAVPQMKFGVAFNEASGPCLTRSDGNNAELRAAAVKICTDVAAGHILAMERGRIGEKYILGHRDMSLKAILTTLAAIAGRPAPRVRVPHWIPLAVAAFDTGLARVRGVAPRFELDAVRLSRKKMYFDPGKAVRELGLPQTPVEEPLRRAVEWFRANGYVDRRAA